MGRFAGIIKKWQSKANAKRIRSALRTLRRADKQFVSNLEADLRITAATLNELLKAWLRCDPTDEARLRDKYARFCAGRNYKGGLDRGARGRRLGHVMSRLKLEEIMKELPFVTSGDSSPRDVADLILKLDLARQKKFLESITLSPKTRPMWSFYDAHAADPFQNIGRNGVVLRGRLGLGHLPQGAELFTLAHRLPPRRGAFIPTTFDARDSKFFRPGGRTRCLGGLKKWGMPEVVHQPNTSAYLEEAICAAIP